MLYTTQPGWSYNAALCCWEYRDWRGQLDGWLTDQAIAAMPDEKLPASLLLTLIRDGLRPQTSAVPGMYYLGVGHAPPNQVRSCGGRTTWTSTAMADLDPCPECGQPVTRIDVTPVTRTTGAYYPFPGYKQEFTEETGEMIWRFYPCGDRLLVGPPSPWRLPAGNGTVGLPTVSLGRHEPSGTGWPDG